VLKSVAKYFCLAVGYISQKFAIWSLSGGFQFTVAVGAILSRPNLNFIGTAF